MRLLAAASAWLCGKLANSATASKRDLIWLHPSAVSTASTAMMWVNGLPSASSRLMRRSWKKVSNLSMSKSAATLAGNTAAVLWIKLRTRTAKPLSSNIRPEDPSAVIGGNERVVRPRLADAQFFFDQDRKKSLESRVSGLDKVIYHNQLGTQGERMLRVCAIAQALVKLLVQSGWTTALKDHETLEHHAVRAARLAKTDLLTDMVGEFPELQGVMGRYYALNDGEDPLVAQAIADHYRPRFAGDELPSNDVGLIVAMADKLET
ncbi:MAG: glycine--tRNA ligase subunit beta, partial [Betaproteobacteria bacterium]|nr:glycine--tRNA ligase subunit beta [Betaproteobacteria bacterium]